MTSTEDKKPGFLRITRHPFLNTIVLGLFGLGTALLGFIVKPEPQVPYGTDQGLSIEEASNRIATLTNGLNEAHSRLEALQASLDVSTSTNEALTLQNERLTARLQQSEIKPPGAPTPFPLVAESRGFGILVKVLDARVSGGDYILPFSILNNGARRDLRMTTNRVQITDGDGNIARPTQIAFGTNRGSYPTATLANNVSARGELIFTGKGALTKHIQHLEVRIQVLSGDGFTAEFTDFYIQE